MKRSAIRKTALNCAVVLALFFALPGQLGSDWWAILSGFPFHPQQGTNWCYAACAEMALHYYHPESWTETMQCENVCMMYGSVYAQPPNGCCSTEAKAASDLVSGEYSRVMIAKGFKLDWSTSPMTWTHLAAQMLTWMGGKTGAPVLSRWYLKDPAANWNRHEVMIVGTEVLGHDAFVIVHDPWPVNGGAYWVITQDAFDDNNVYTRYPPPEASPSTYDLTVNEVPAYVP